MLTPPTLVRRRPIALVTSVASLAFAAGLLTGVVALRARFQAPPELGAPSVRPAPPPVSTDRTNARLTARISPRFQQLDLLSPGEYVADGTMDEVIDVTMTAPLAVKHIIVNGNGGYHQWDTVIGAESIPFGPVFRMHRGDETWHLGVRTQGQWRTNPETGALPPLPAGTYALELIGDGVADSGGTRTVTIVFVDGTTITADVAFSAPCYASQLGGCGGDGNANQR